MHESEESGQPRVVLNVRAVDQWVVGLSTLSSRAAKVDSFCPKVLADRSSHRCGKLESVSGIGYSQKKTYRNNRFLRYSRLHSDRFFHSKA